MDPLFTLSSSFFAFSIKNQKVMLYVFKPTGALSGYSLKKSPVFYWEGKEKIIRICQALKFLRRKGFLVEKMI